ncbi:MAG TPA: T9SS type A sorting domain-containing protein [Flavobacterium sp.]|jgi:hypothetical protein
MKKIYFLILVLLVTSANAQNYNFVNSTAPYANLTAANSLNNGEAWDDPEYPLLLPFSFMFNGTFTNMLLINDSYITVADNPSMLQVISPLSADLVDRGVIFEDTSLSPLSYKIEGSPGSRIVKIEFNNCGAFNDNNLTMFVNFQVWLYETSNIIEFRYGPSSVPTPAIFYDGESGGLIGLTDVDFDSEELTNTLFLIGSPAAPTTATVPAFITGTPANGTLYRFIPTNLALDQHSKNTVQLYPNPANEVLNIGGDYNAASYQIYDSTGKLISNGVINAESTIDVSQLQTGMYFIKLDSAAAVKFLKS